MVLEKREYLRMWITDWYELDKEAQFIWDYEELERYLKKNEKISGSLILVDVFSPGGELGVTSTLKKLTNLVEKKSSILILASNRLGLKFWAGAPEEHTNIYFEGLENYTTEGVCYTYSRAEWKNILDKIDAQYRFFYPYPDFYFPQEIFSDKTVNDYGYGRPSPNYGSRRYELFNEQKVAQALSGSKIMQEFANSFIIEVNPKEEIKEYTKFSDNRKDEFCVVTSIKSDDTHRWVEKAAKSNFGNRHIHNLYRNTQEEACLRLHPVVQTNEKTISYDFLEWDNYDILLVRAIDQQDVGQIQAVFNAVYKIACEGAYITSYGTDEFAEWFGEKPFEEDLCVCPANIDIILDNIYTPGDVGEIEKRQVIDGEWILNSPVPVLFIFWRVVNEAYYKHPSLEAILQMKDVYKLYGVTDEMCDKFQQWNRHFTLEYVGAGMEREFPQNKVDHLSINDIRWNVGPGRRVHVHLYWLEGGDKDYSEERKIFREAMPIGDYSYRIAFNKKEFANSLKVRVDLQKGHYCRCRILKTEGVVSIKSRLPLKSKEGYEYSYLDETSYEIELQDDVDNFVIEYEIQDVGKELTHEMIVESSERKKAYDELRVDIHSLQQENSSIMEKNHSLEERSLELQNKNQQLEGYINQLEVNKEKLENLVQKLDIENQQRENTIQQLVVVEGNLRQELETIKQTRIYKLVVRVKKTYIYRGLRKMKRIFVTRFGEKR